MKTLYSKSDIRRFRRSIPIQGLIVDILKIPSTTANGYCQFRCPKCGNSNAGIKVGEKKNRALCPDCETYFNPIDLVMAHKDIGFKQAADFLHNLKMV